MHRGGYPARPLSERFWAKVHKTDGCWLWTAKANRRGYGAIGSNGRTYSAHRVSWELTRGPIPDDLFVLHRCDTPGCVNPDHLFLGTAADNMHDCVEKKRQWLIRKTHCKRGHPFDAANTIPVAKGRGRECRACKEMRAKESWQRVLARRMQKN